MIGFLKGTIGHIFSDRLILDVQGVGYEIECPLRILEHLPETGEVLSLWIETMVRETEIRLLGFETLYERDWYRLLITVQGVGAKVALALLGLMKPEEIAQAVLNEDKAAIMRTPGVGKRVAERVVIELKDKAGLLGGEDLVLQPNKVQTVSAVSQGKAELKDAVSALCNLGYKPQDAQKAVQDVYQDQNGLETSELIRLALKRLAR